MFKALTDTQFKKIREHIALCNPKLVICDFNGVLDDYYECKYEYLGALLGPGNISHLASLAVFTDTEYGHDQTASLESSTRKYAHANGLALDPSANEYMKLGMRPSQLTSEARAFLKDIAPVPLVVYTAQPSVVVEQYKAATHDTEWKSAEQLGSAKPSVANLEEIMRQHQVAANEVCVIGDGLIDDLMPAKLLGAHTILVSPFADIIV